MEIVVTDTDRNEESDPGVAGEGTNSRRFGAEGAEDLENSGGGPHHPVPLNPRPLLARFWA